MGCWLDQAKFLLEMIPDISLAEKNTGAGPKAEQPLSTGRWSHTESSRHRTWGYH